MARSTTQTFTITGTNFVSGATVSFVYNGTTTLPVTSVTWTNATTMTFRYATGNNPGNFPVTVTVTNPDGGTSNSFAFTLGIT
jgi:hypothetical protein